MHPGLNKYMMQLRMESNEKHFLFLHGSTGKDLVQPTVFELFDLDLPAELLRILELGLQFKKPFCFFLNGAFCFL